MFQFATINVVSVLGNEQNVTKEIQRWPVDALNNKQLGVVAKHHDEENHDMALHDVGVTESLEKLHENGEDAVSLDPENFHFALEEHEFVFVDFFAGWCSHCQRCKSVQSRDVLQAAVQYRRVTRRSLTFHLHPCLFRCCLFRLQWHRHGNALRK
jgi:hypothetical protein